ncbi:DUF2612 domain-containing protein [Methylobacterium brachiatum]|uniref:DUF2612 domain-containing protein n=1 Tax=Methylobacterium brachiatum TaxID=269660 RepID=UPI000EFA89E6|nr:DUF2612 domain-containing protein [Methylobacterium brachiatum]AYO83569.1 DUF2612 domain-containing protein [Methylobacterium brachiatum]
MSGAKNNWPYPAPPGVGSNAVGIGAIGEAPFGTLPAFDWRKTILSQYADSDRITGLIGTFFGATDQTANFDAFYDKIFNLDTAEGYGLDVWGRIVGVNRVLQVANNQFFGFAEAGDALPFGDARFQGYGPHFGFVEAGDAQPFGQAPFGAAKVFSGVDPNAGGGIFYVGGQLTSNYALSDEAYRQLIYAKAAANITDGAIPSINRILINIFPGRGNCYVQEDSIPAYFGFAEATSAHPFEQAPFYNGQALPYMVMQYVFRFQLSPLDRAIVAQSGVLPKPVGVAASVVVLP